MRRFLMQSMHRIECPVDALLEQHKRFKASDELVTINSWVFLLLIALRKCCSGFRKRFSLGFPSIVLEARRLFTHFALALSPKFRIGI